MDREALIDQSLIAYIKENPEGVTHCNQSTVASALNQLEAVRRSGFTGTEDISCSIQRLVEAGAFRSECSGYRLNA